MRDMFHQSENGKLSSLTNQVACRGGVLAGCYFPRCPREVPFSSFNSPSYLYLFVRYLFLLTSLILSCYVYPTRADLFNCFSIAIPATVLFSDLILESIVGRIRGTKLQTYIRGKPWSYILTSKTTLNRVSGGQKITLWWKKLSVSPSNGKNKRQTNKQQNSTAR